LPAVLSAVTDALVHLGS